MKIGEYLKYKYYNENFTNTYHIYVLAVASVFVHVEIKIVINIP